MKIIVTGAAGFIGYHVSKQLIGRGDSVIGIDNLNAYYDVSLKEARLALLEHDSGFAFQKLDVSDRSAVEALFRDSGADAVVHLAAQAGVRYSLENPHAYADSNLTGFVNVLEGCRRHPVKHLVYASSSSVYGNNKSVPFRVSDPVDHPISLYAATKKANELMAHTYSHLYGIPATGLRFFTVYGPWGRPDMAYFLFTKAIVEGKPIDVFNHGKLRRDFTYIDDIVEGVVRVLDNPPEPHPDVSASDTGPGASAAPYRIYNIGNNEPMELQRFIELIESNLGKTAEKNYLPMQPGDVEQTYADVEALRRDVGFSPSTPIEDGIARFVAWYREYYGVE